MNNDKVYCTETMWESGSEDSYGFTDNLEIRNMFFQGMSYSLAEARLHFYYDIINNDIRLNGNAIYKEFDGFLCTFCDTGLDISPDSKFHMFIMTPDEFMRCLYEKDLMFCHICNCLLWNCEDDKSKWEEYEKQVHDDFFVTECVNNFHFTDSNA